jgi:hypothetical protein
MTSRKKTKTTARSAASNAPITSKYASKLLSSTTAQHLLEDTADDVQTAEEFQAAKSPNQTKKLQPPATLQKVASQEEDAATSDLQSLRDASLAARLAKSKLKKLVRSTGDDLIQSKGFHQRKKERIVAGQGICKRRVFQIACSLSTILQTTKRECITRKCFSTLGIS